MIPPDLESALTAADAAGCHLSVAGDTIRVRAGWSPLPDTARDAVRRHKPTGLALLSGFPRPAPSLLTFVRRNLLTFDVPAPLVVGQQHVWRSGHCYHRLTPAVLAYLEQALARRLPSLDTADRDTLLARCRPLWAYCVAYFRPDQMGRAFLDPPVTLAEPPCPSPAIIGGAEPGSPTAPTANLSRQRATPHQPTRRPASSRQRSAGTTAAPTLY